MIVEEGGMGEEKMKRREALKEKKTNNEAESGMW